MMHLYVNVSWIYSENLSLYLLFINVTCIHVYVHNVTYIHLYLHTHCSCILSVVCTYKKLHVHRFQYFNCTRLQSLARGKFNVSVGDVCSLYSLFQCDHSFSVSILPHLPYPTVCPHQFHLFFFHLHYYKHMLSLPPPQPRSVPRPGPPRTCYC